MANFDVIFIDIIAYFCDKFTFLLVRIRQCVWSIFSFLVNIILNLIFHIIYSFLVQNIMVAICWRIFEVFWSIVQRILVILLNHFFADKFVWFWLICRDIRIKGALFLGQKKGVSLFFLFFLRPFFLQGRLFLSALFQPLFFFWQPFFFRRGTFYVPSPLGHHVFLLRPFFQGFLLSFIISREIPKGKNNCPRARAYKK